MMLRCERCGIPVLLMTGEQEERYIERPSAYTYLCVTCRGDVADEDPGAEDDADGD